MATELRMMEFYDDSETEDQMSLYENTPPKTGFDSSRFEVSVFNSKPQDMCFTLFESIIHLLPESLFDPCFVIDKQSTSEVQEQAPSAVKALFESELSESELEKDLKQNLLKVEIPQGGKELHPVTGNEEKQKEPDLAVISNENKKNGEDSDDCVLISSSSEKNSLSFSDAIHRKKKPFKKSVWRPVKRRQAFSGDKVDERDRASTKSARQEIESHSAGRKRNSSRERYSDETFGKRNTNSYRRARNNEEPTTRRPSEDDLPARRDTVPSRLVPKASTSQDSSRCNETDTAYYCDLCNLELRSQVTWESHMTGKKHAKTLNALNVKDVAQASLTTLKRPAFDMFSSSNLLLSDLPRPLPPAPGCRRIELNDRSSIQNLLDRLQDRPTPGLRYVTEIRLRSETVFYCALCRAPCQPVSILGHLQGFRHQLHSLMKIDPRLFEECRLCPGKVNRSRVEDRLLMHERRNGKDLIAVVVDVPEDCPRSQEPLPPNNYRVDNFAMKTAMENFEELTKNKPSYDECIDTSSGDFKCKVCDAHMNNMAMWEAHVRGKRHLKNVKKSPGEHIRKMKFVMAPSAYPSSLLSRISRTRPRGPIVGLNEIKESHAENGISYTCFPCGARCTDLDIIEHLLLVKHKIKYLEKLNAEGYVNDIATINEMDVKEYFREQLVNEACNKLIRKFGSGKPQVYVPRL